MDGEKSRPARPDQLVAPDRYGRARQDGAHLLRSTTAMSHRIHGHRQCLPTHSQSLGDFRQETFFVRVLVGHTCKQDSAFC